MTAPTTGRPLATHSNHPLSVAERCRRDPVSDPRTARHTCSAKRYTALLRRVLDPKQHHVDVVVITDLRVVSS